MYYHSLTFYHNDMAHVTTDQTTARHGRTGLTGAIPPHAYFLVSAVFHYLGPAFALLLFAHVGVLGVAWLRIASAAAVFAACDKSPTQRRSPASPSSSAAWPSIRNATRAHNRRNHAPTREFSRRAGC